MGRVTSEPKKETPTTVTHFSHPHPLKLITTTDHHHQQQQTLNLSSSSTSSCSGCNLDLSGTIYSCTVCKDFSLHKKCFDMPMKITHPFHKEHALTLLPEPTYDEGLFKCDACGEAGKCFSYHCEPCGVDLHVLCAAVPLTLTRASHHMHKLDLIFESPYDTKDFSCDVCKKPGGDHWLYRCSPCEFDAHLSCAAIVPAPPPVFPPPPVAPPPLQQNVHSNFIGLQSQTLPPQQLTEFTKSVPPPPPQMQGFIPQYGGAPPPPQMQGLGPQYGGAPPPPPPQTQGFAPHFGGAPPPPPPHLHGFPPQLGAAPPSPQMRGFRALAPPSVQQNYGPPPPMMNNHAVGMPTGGPNHHQQLVANKQHGEYLSSYNGTLHRIMSNGSAMGQAAATLAGGVVGVGASFAGHLGGVGSDMAQQVKQMISPIHNGGGSGGIGSVIHGVNAIGGVGGLIPSMDSFGGGGGDGGGLDMVASLLGEDGGGLDILVGALGCLTG